MATKTLAKYIQEYRQTHNLSLRDFAAECDLSHTYISKLEKGIDDRTGAAIEPNLQILEQIAKGTHTDLTNLLMILGKIDSSLIYYDDIPLSESEDAQMEHVVQLPILGEIRAGEPIFADEHIMGYEYINKDEVKTGKFFFLHVVGDSMINARIYDGDTVLVRKQEDVDNRDIAVCLVNDDTATLKRVMKTDQGIFLQPENPKYDPLFFSHQQVLNGEVKIIGKVIKVIFKL